MRPIAPRSHAGNYRCSSGRLCGRHRRGRCPRPGSECVGRSSTHPASAVSFYTSPADLADYRPGDVRAARPVSAPAGFLNTDAVQLKFRSTNSEGHPIAAVTTVLSPRGAAPGRPLLSYQHIINALGLGCAPSTAMYTDDPKLAIREAPGLNVAIAKGWSVAIPDHLGPPRAYGAAKLGGPITLDGYPRRATIRRARPRREPRWDGRLLRRRNGDCDGRGDRPDLRSGTRARGQRLRRRSDEHRQDGQGLGPAKTPGIRAGYGRGTRSRT